MSTQFVFGLLGKYILCRADSQKSCFGGQPF